MNNRVKKTDTKGKSIIPVKWVTSLELEVIRMAFTISQIARGFYYVNRFPIIYYSKKDGVISNDIKRSVIVPDIDFHSIHRIWERAKPFDLNKPGAAEKKFMKEVRGAMIEWYKTLGASNENDIEAFIHEMNFKQVDASKKIWDEHEAEILAELYDVAPDLHDIVKEVEIRLSSFGTSGSFSFASETKNVAEIVFRSDANTFRITNSILHSAFKPILYDQYFATWTESQIAVDFMAFHSKLAKKIRDIYHNRHAPSSRIFRGKFTSKTLALTRRFYDDVGLSFNETYFKVVNDKPYFKTKMILNLTKKQELVLNRLINGAGKVLSHENLSDALVTSKDGMDLNWLQAEQFSLYKVTKFIERLRKTLELNGIPGSSIQSVPGKGYTIL